MPAPVLDDLVAMAIFAHVVRTESFTAAAAELGLSKSAVSRSVARLEEHLGAKLLHRTTRRMGLTEAGAELYDHARRIVAEAEAAEVAVAGLGEEPRGTLRVNGPILFGERYLAPAVPDLLQRHPELHIELTLTDRFVDLVEENVDVAIRITARLTPSSSLVARKLAPDLRVVVASPEYLARRGTPETPHDLVHHDCVRYALLSAQDEWRFVGAQGAFSVPVTSRLESNHGGVLRAAAIGGVGLAVAPMSLVGDDVREGRLVPVLSGWLSTEQGAIYAVYPLSRQPAPKVRAFVEFMLERVRGTVLWTGAA